MSILFALALIVQPQSSPPAVAPTQPAAPTQAEPTQLERFLTGRTQGAGNVEIMLSGRKTVQTQGIGTALPDGSFRLEHVLRQQGEPERRLTWNVRRAGPNRYAGTITDVRRTVPVTAQVTGNVMRAEYRSSEGYWIDQTLTIDPDGRSAANTTRIFRSGIRVAVLQETIRKVD